MTTAGKETPQEGDTVGGSTSRFFLPKKKRPWKTIGEVPDASRETKKKPVTTNTPARNPTVSPAPATEFDDDVNNMHGSDVVERGITSTVLKTTVVIDDDGVDSSEMSSCPSVVVTPPSSADNPEQEVAETSKELDNEEEANAAEGTLDKGSSVTNPQQNNPFAQFAFQDGSSRLVPHLGSQNIGRDRPSQSYFSSGKERIPQTSKKPVTQRKHSQKMDRSDINKKQQNNKSGWVRMADLSLEEQQKIQRKWHSLADPRAPLEVRRFQVLVASRLHARCQEPVVRKTMQALREVFSATSEGNHGGGDGLCVAMVAQADPEVLANIISSVQYYNSKAQHIVKAAQEIQTRFGGKVPETEHSLRQLTGIGPVMADLLAFVNTRAAHNNNSSANSDPPSAPTSST